MKNIFLQTQENKQTNYIIYGKIIRRRFNKAFSSQTIKRQMNIILKNINLYYLVNLRMSFKRFFKKKYLNHILFLTQQFYNFRN